MYTIAKTKFQASAISLYGNRHTVFGSFFMRTFFKQTESKRTSCSKKEGNVPGNDIRLVID